MKRFAKNDGGYMDEDESGEYVLFASVNEWQPIETAPILAFDKAKWWASHSPSLLLWNGNWCEIGFYGYTQKGRGSWSGVQRKIHNPTHWMPLPEPPK